MLYAVGLDGQTITVDPGNDLVIVQTATDDRVSLPLTEATLDAWAG
ncbi:MAG: hypothetical protein ACRDWS_16440 [Acidimicrobiia bacterium]